MGCQMINYVEVVEDYLCELCDEVFNDGIVCDKVFNPEERVNRAASVLQVYAPSADQPTAIHTMSARVVENRERRAQCITDMELSKKLVKSRVKLENGLEIYINIQYINAPIRTIVGTQNTYTLSVYLTITLM